MSNIPPLITIENAVITIFRGRGKLGDESIIACNVPSYTTAMGHIIIRAVISYQADTVTASLKMICPWSES